MSHGLSRTPEYQVWAGMVNRCHGSSGASKDYADRGIKVCDEWLSNPAEFINHVGMRPTEFHSLDRIDNDRGYEPGNVRWATRAEQARNRSNTIKDLRDRTTVDLDRRVSSRLRVYVAKNYLKRTSLRDVIEQAIIEYLERHDAAVSA